ncbi:hypothetical protein AAAU94_22085, partial [Bacteroides cellulosilyticus]
MDFAFFAIAFNIKKMCAKLRKAGKEFITLAKSIFIGLFITRYNGNIATCYQMNEKKRGVAKRKDNRTINYRKRLCQHFDTTSFLCLQAYDAVLRLQIFIFQQFADTLRDDFFICFYL